MSRSHRKGLPFVSVLIFAFVVCLSAHSQVTGGTFTGTVTDSSGAVIPNAQISILNLATGVTRVVMTDSAGFCVAPNLSPGNHEITAAGGAFLTMWRWIDPRGCAGIVRLRS
jgi:hypothetical protein